jgi:hypothetical protein
MVISLSSTPGEGGARLNFIYSVIKFGSYRDWGPFFIICGLLVALSTHAPVLLSVWTRGDLPTVPPH